MSERLAKAAKLAAKNDIILVLENEYSCNVGTGKELGKLIKHVNSPNLRGLWDAGNAAFLNETPFPDGYEACKGTFAHMHNKDAATNPNTGKHVWMAVGGGTIDFKGQFAALRKKGTAAQCPWRLTTGVPTETKWKAPTTQSRDY